MPDIVDYPGIGFRVGRTEPFKEAEHPFLECPRDHELRLANASLRLDDKQGLTIQNLSLVPDGSTVRMRVPSGLSIQAGDAAPALTVAPNGNVGIGTPTPDPGTRLHVEGGILTSGENVAGLTLGDRDRAQAGGPQWTWYAERGSLRLVKDSGGGDALRIGPSVDLVNTDGRHTLAVGGHVTVGGDLAVRGKLHLQSPQNVIKVQSTTLAVRNQGVDRPGEWTFRYPQPFTEIYGHFAVLQGFSLWDYKDNVRFDVNPVFHTYDRHGPPHHVYDGAIVQHIFVRVNSCTSVEARGVAYCSEARAEWEGDNTILLTVVVLGRIE